MKGKKFTAAEKHFNEKLEKINREMKALKEENRKLRERNEFLEKRDASLCESINNLIEDNKKLMEYSNMTEEELQNAKQRDRALANVGSIGRIMGTSLAALGLGYDFGGIHKLEPYDESLYPNTLWLKENPFIAKEEGSK